MPYKKKPTKITKAYKKIEKGIAKALHEDFMNSLWVMPKILQEYEPPDDIVRITEFMLGNGETNPARICEMLDIKEEKYIRLMRSPRNIAWMSQLFMRHIPYLIGRLDMVMYHKALEGSVPAYRAVIERFNLGGVHKSVSVTVDARPSELAELSSEQLERLIEDKTRKAGIGHEEERERREGKIIEGASGAGKTQEGSAAPVLQAPPEAE